MQPRIEVKPSVITYPLGTEVGCVQLFNDAIRFETTRFDEYEHPISLDISLKEPNERAAFRYIIDQILKHIDAVDEGWGEDKANIVC
ncbi:MAG: hypothetical protein JWN92_561 [Candidatus Acidoferrum typicum]|nr:hypothetical protein [Candidatus Acidoferrum typicum]